MKKNLLLLLTMMTLFYVNAQVIVESVGIAKTGLDVSNSTVLEQIQINPSSSGKVIVRFDGYCISSPGDLIVLAASNTASWGVNDGNVNVEAYNSDINTNSFSHSRVYDVTAGTHTYYAIAHNYMKTDGNGVASIYGNLSVEFYPSTSGAIIESVPISFSGNVTNLQTLAQININPNFSGNAIVRFDGQINSDYGDRILLAANDVNNYGVNEEHTTIEAMSADVNRRSFSHTKVVSVSPGSKTFYAVVQRSSVEHDGSGTVYIYGNLTVELYPSSVVLIVANDNVLETNVDLTNKKLCGFIGYNQNSSGKTLAHFDGYCYSSPGDRIELAATHDANWHADDGHVSVEALNSDINVNPFSHTRLYNCSTGSNSFNAVGQNYVETDGDGIASIYGNFYIKYFTSTALSNESFQYVKGFNMYPNPVENLLNLTAENVIDHVTIFNTLGQKITELLPMHNFVSIDVSTMKPGFYIVQVQAGAQLASYNLMKN